MIGDSIVVDAVVHPYNLALDNQNPAAREQLETVYAAHCLSFDPGHARYALTHEEFFSFFSFDAMAHSEFVESPVDFAIIHSLPNLGLSLKHMTDPYRAAAFRDRYPGRFAVYATIDTPIVTSAVEQLERQVRELAVDGLKLYPAFFYEGKGVGWRLDGDDFATPLLKAAQKLGVRHVAVHKVLWLPPAPRDSFSIDDLPTSMEQFPELTFEIVHAGVAFLDETRRLLERHPNLYLNWETSFSYILTKPRVFARMLATLLMRCGSERLMFATGNNLAHPRPILEAFASLPIFRRDHDGVWLSANHHPRAPQHRGHQRAASSRPEGERSSRSRKRRRLCACTARARWGTVGAAAPRGHGLGLMTRVHGSPLTRADLLSELRQVTEPCSIAMGNRMDIVSMGLVEEVELYIGHARVTLCLTDPGCIHFVGMRQFICDLLKELPGISSVEVRQARNKLWTPDRVERTGGGLGA